MKLNLKFDTLLGSHAAGMEFRHHYHHDSWSNESLFALLEYTFMKKKFLENGVKRFH